MLRGTGRRFRLTIDRQYRVRTDERTIDAPRARVGRQLHEPVSTDVELVGEPEALLGTGMDAQLTSFTDIVSNENCSSYHGILCVVGSAIPGVP